MKDKIVKTVLRRSEDPVKDGLNEFDANQLHLYVESLDGSFVKGAQSSVLVGHAKDHDNWKSLLEEWADENRFLDFQPNKYDAVGAGVFLNECRRIISENKSAGLRLGQVIMNELGENTPTPNPDIFYSLDESKVLQWFYDQHVNV